MDKQPTYSSKGQSSRLSTRRRDIHEGTFYREEYGDRLRVEAILKLCRKVGVRGERLIDVGCGDGSVTQAVAKQVGATDVIGIDIAAQVKKIEERGFKALVVDLEENDIPYADGTFDVAMCGNVLHHMFDPDHLLRELYRVLKDTGYLVISNRNLGAWYNRLALLLGYQPFLLSPSLDYAGVGKLFTKERGAGGHTGGFTERAFKRLLQLQGFSIMGVAGAANTPPPEYASKWLRTLNAVLNSLVSPLNSLAPFTIVVAKKASLPSDDKNGRTDEPTNENKR